MPHDPVGLLPGRHPNSDYPVQSNAPTSPNRVDVIFGGERRVKIKNFVKFWPVAEIEDAIFPP